MLSFMSKYVPDPQPPTGDGGTDIADASLPGMATRDVARALKRRMQQAGEMGPHLDSLAGQTHSVTGGDIMGFSGTYVAHAWDADFRELVDCLVTDSQGDLDKRYLVDVFGADLHTGLEDPVTVVQQRVGAAQTVLLLVSGKCESLQRLWVVFEALLALQAGKLQVRCAAPGGFGDSEAALKLWEANIDAVDWALADVTLKSDEKRLKAFAEKEWEVGGKGVERMLAQLRKSLRQDVYSQILSGAVAKGDLQAVRAALDLGADPEVQDALGNTGEAVAAFNGNDEIADLLFEHRMRKHFHAPLSEWALDPRQLAASDQAGWFVTEYLGGKLPEEVADDEEDLHIAGLLLGLSEPSTCTPNLSSRAESSRSA
jgi:hypothetical protein